MRLLLEAHPASRSAAIQAIEIDISREPAGFNVCFRLVGKAADVKRPPAKASARADELWRTTCFEAFLGTDDGGYYELNFAPSTEWAVYRFDAYRTGMRPSDDLGVPRITTHGDPDGYELVASFGTRPDATRLGISAILEDRDGTQSYWALAHAGSRPDFHHPSSFALDIPELT